MTISQHQQSARNGQSSLGRLAQRLLPSRCALCAGLAPAGRELCHGCRADLPRIENACPRCALKITLADTSGLCARCAAQPPRFHRAVAPLAYEYPVDRLLLGLKFGKRIYLARALAHEIASKVREDIERGLLEMPQALVPVPLHPKRLAERGFNQAEEIARFAGRNLGVPVRPGICRRIRHTSMQSRLSDEQRRANVAGAFHCSDAPPHPAIVDDVFTTGATVESMAAALIDAGAEQVQVWTMARAG